FLAIRLRSGWGLIRPGVAVGQTFLAELHEDFALGQSFFLHYRRRRDKLIAVRQRRLGKGCAPDGDVVDPTPKWIVGPAPVAAANHEVIAVYDWAALSGAPHVPGPVE